MSVALRKEEAKNMSDTTYYTVRMESLYPYALVLQPGNTRPEKLEGFFGAKEIHKHMQDNFGPDVKQLPRTQFQTEVEHRAIHTLEMQGLLMQHGIAEQDLTNFFVYGSACRPMGSWAQIESAIYIQVSQQTTGYYTYIAVPTKLDEALVDEYELTFISHP
jgi:hypothetical protein